MLSASRIAEATAVPIPPHTTPHATEFLIAARRRGNLLSSDIKISGSSNGDYVRVLCTVK